MESHAGAVPLVRSKLLHATQIQFEVDDVNRT
jgi:hypothetical protein